MDRMIKMNSFKFEVLGKMNEDCISNYRDQFCRVIIEKKNKQSSKSKNRHECLFCTVGNVNDKKVFVNDTKGSGFGIPIESIKSIWVNEEQ